MMLAWEFSELTRETRFTVQCDLCGKRGEGRHDQSERYRSLVTPAPGFADLSTCLACRQTELLAVALFY
jgi:hypothetical protein